MQIYSPLCRMKMASSEHAGAGGGKAVSSVLLPALTQNSDHQVVPSLLPLPISCIVC